MMISHHKERDNGNGLDRVSEYILTYNCHKNHKFNLWLLQNQMMKYQMRILRLLIPHHHQLGHHNQLNREVVPEDPKDRSRSRERIHPRSSSHASSQQQQQPVVPPSGVQKTQTLAIQSEDEDSATVGAQNRVSDQSKSPQDQEDSRRQGPQKQKGKKLVAEKQPSTPPKAKRHTSPWIQMRTMKNMKMSLKPLQTLNLLYQYYFFIKDQLPARKHQLPVQFLVMN